MAPPYRYDINADEVMDLDFGFDPEDSSLIRPSDTDLYEHGVASPYQDKAMLLSEARALAEDNATSLLMSALNKQADVSPEQGLATALLAAIPTIGGYFIGKSVGRPNLPEGYFEAGGTRAAIGLDKGQYGAEYGALAGLGAGTEAAQGYLKALEGDQAQRNEITKSLANIQMNRASRLETQANQYEIAALNKQAELDMLPIKEASQMRLQNNSAQNTMERQLELQSRKDALEKLDPETLAKVQESLGLPSNPNMTTDQLRVVTNAIAEDRRKINQDTRLSGENLIPPSSETKKAMTNVLQTKGIGERYINQFSQLAANNPGWLERTVESVLPATELGQLQDALQLFAVQVRNARESGVMTEQDYKRYSSYLTLKPLDTMQSVLARMRELQVVTDISADSILTSAELGQENVSNYRKLFPSKINPTVATGNSARIPISERIKQIQGLQ